MIHSQWSSEDDKRLESFIKEDMEFKDIASNLGRSEAAARKRASTLGISKGNYIKWSERDKDKLKYLVSKGLKIELISSKMSRTLESVSNMMHKLKLRSKNKKWGESEIADLKKLFESGSNIYEISSKLNRPIGSIGNKLKEMGYSLRKRNNEKKMLDKSGEKAVKSVIFDGLSNKADSKENG